MIFKLGERLWGSLAHVPTITLIWGGYLLYRCLTDVTFLNKILNFSCTNIQSPPLAPIVLTLLGIPISLSIKYLKKRSKFICNNAQQAYLFNLWLLKRYATLFILSFVGIYFSFKYLIMVSTIVGGLISIVCLQQSITGIATALRGKVYHYWYISNLWK